MFPALQLISFNLLSVCLFSFTKLIDCLWHESARDWDSRVCLCAVQTAGGLWQCPPLPQQPLDVPGASSGCVLLCLAVCLPGRLLSPEEGAWWGWPAAQHPCRLGWWLAAAPKQNKIPTGEDGLASGKAGMWMGATASPILWFLWWG